MKSKFTTLQPNKHVRLLHINGAWHTRKAGHKNPAFFVPIFDMEQLYQIAMKTRQNAK